MTIPRDVALGLLVLAAVSCSPVPMSGRPAPGDGATLSGFSGTVLGPTDLGSFGTLTDALQGRVPGLRLRHDGGCPAVSLRRANAPSPFSSPTVCVDGIRTGGTCALTELSIHDVERVEIYPAGAPSRPTCTPGGAGLILIVTKVS